MLKSGGGSKGSGGPADKKQTIMAVVAIVIIIGVGAYFAMSFMGGGGDDYSADTSMPMDNGAQMQGAPPPPGTQMPDGSVPPTPPGPTATPEAQPTQQANAPAPAPAGQPVQNARPATNAKADDTASPTKQIKVFGAVNVTYPSTWKIDASVANHAAVFTNGTGFFEVRTPSPKADSAKAIADAALKTYTPNGAVTAQGEDKIAGHDAYWYAVSIGSQTVRIVGVDAPTRVVLLARAPKGVYAAYRTKFDGIQKSLTF